MLELGPVSSLFDIVTFAALFFVVCPAAVGASWSELAGTGNVAGMATFCRALPEWLVCRVHVVTNTGGPHAALPASAEPARPRRARTVRSHRAGPRRLSPAAGKPHRRCARPHGTARELFSRCSSASSPPTSRSPSWQSVATSPATASCCSMQAENTLPADAASADADSLSLSSCGEIVPV